MQEDERKSRIREEMLQYSNLSRTHERNVTHFIRVFEFAYPHTNMEYSHKSLKAARVVQAGFKRQQYVNSTHVEACMRLI